SEQGTLRRNWRRRCRADRFLFLSERFRVLPAGNRPAEEKERHDADPERPGKNGECGQARSSDQTDHAGNLQAANFPERKPEKTAKNLPAIEWINREHVKNEQDEIDDANHPDEAKCVWRFISPAGMLRENPQDLEDRDQRNIDQRPRGNAPENRARPSRRTYEGDTAERPKDDAIGIATSLPACERMAKFVEKDNAEKRDVFIQRKNRR